MFGADQKFCPVLSNEVEEGTTTIEESRTIFTPEKVYTSEMMAEYYTHYQTDEQVQFLEGHVGNRRSLRLTTIFPDGGNFTIKFESYDMDGSLAWATNVVNIRYCENQAV